MKDGDGKSDCWASAGVKTWNAAAAPSPAPCRWRRWTASSRPLESPAWRRAQWVVAAIPRTAGGPSAPLAAASDAPSGAPARCERPSSASSQMTVHFSLRLLHLTAARRNRRRSERGRLNCNVTLRILWCDGNVTLPPRYVAISGPRYVTLPSRGSSAASETTPLRGHSRQLRGSVSVWPAL